MKAIKNKYGEFEVVAWDEEYDETSCAEPSSRVLEGSRDHGYDQEYIGGGTVDGIPVSAVYLLDDDDYNSDDDGNPDEDAGNWDWDAAAKQGRLLVDVDKLTEAEYDALEAGEEIQR